MRAGSFKKHMTGRCVVCVSGAEILTVNNQTASHYKAQELCMIGNMEKLMDGMVYNAASQVIIQPGLNR